MSVNYNPATPTDGLVLCIDPSNPRCYPGSGTTVFDLSGNNNNGTLTNGASVINTRGGRALDFDGVNDYVQVSSGVNVTSSITCVSAWIQTPDLSLSSNFPRLIDISDGTNSAQIVLDLGAGGSDQVVTKHTQYQSGITGTQWGYLPTSQIWEHIFVIFDSITSTTQVYRNGIAQSGAANNNVGASTAINQIYVGARRDLNAQTHWQGRMDAVMIYARRFTEPEIRQLFESKRGKYL